MVCLTQENTMGHSVSCVWVKHTRHWVKHARHWDIGVLSCVCVKLDTRHWVKTLSVLWCFPVSVSDGCHAVSCVCVKLDTRHWVRHRHKTLSSTQTQDTEFDTDTRHWVSYGVFHYGVLSCVCVKLVQTLMVFSCVSVRWVLFSVLCLCQARSNSFDKKTPCVLCVVCLSLCHVSCVVSRVSCLVSSVLSCDWQTPCV